MSLFKKYVQQSVLFIGLLILGITCLLLMPSHARADNSISPLPGGMLTADECAWVYDSLLTCGTSEFWYNADLSDDRGSAVFQYRYESGDHYEWHSNAYLIIGSGGDEFTITSKVDQGAGAETAQGNITDREKRKIRAIAKDGSSKDIYGKLNGGTVPADGKSVGSDGASYYTFCGVLSAKGNKCFNGLGNNLYTIQSDVAATSSKKLDEEIASEESCDADMDGALSFIFCPLLTYTRESVTKLIGTSADASKRGYLIELLTISPLTQSSGSNLYDVWKVFRDLSLALYILVFIVIIFGNSLGMDSYTIKRTLPRLATASVLTMASFYIVQALVDLSNLLGAGLPALISNITNGNANIANFSLDLGAGASALGIIVLILLSVIALFAVLVGMAGLIFRQIAIYILVIISPLAFVAWVLPNTENLFKRWWTNLFKLCMMFPMITGMIAMSLLFQKSLDTSTASMPLKLAAMAAPLLALIAIPNTFKWGGELFAAGAGFLAGRASQAINMGKGAGKSALGQSMKDGVGARGIQKLGTKMETDPDTGAQMRVARRGFGVVPGMGGVTARKRAIKQGQREAAIKNRYSEGLKDISDDNLVNIFSTIKKKGKEGGAYGSAVKGELNKRKGKALADYASAVRDGRPADYEEGLVRKLSYATAGVNKESARVIDTDRLDRTGKPITEAGKAIKTTDQAEARMDTVRRRADRQTNGPTPLNTSMPVTPSTPHAAPPVTTTSTPVVSHPAITPTAPPPPSSPMPTYTTPPPPPPAGTPIYTTPTAPPPPPSGTPVYTTTSSTSSAAPANVTNNVTVNGGASIGGATSGSVPMSNQEVMDGLADLSDQIRNSGGGDVMSGLSREESAKLDKVVRTAKEASSASEGTQESIENLKSRTMKNDRKLKEGIQDLGDENSEE